MKKNKFLLLLIALMTAFTLALVSCGGGNGDNDDDGDGESQSQQGQSQSESESESESDSEIEHYLSLDKTSATMILGDEAYVVDPMYDIQDGATLTYSSSDETVVSVNASGKFFAEGLGNATITVSYADLSATCEVTVSLGETFPELKLANVSDKDLAEGMTIETLSELDLSATISFNSKTFEDAEYSYVVADESFGSVVDGVFTPAGPKGTTTITVSATWRGLSEFESLSKTINVTIVGVLELYVNSGDKAFNLLTFDDPAAEGDEHRAPFVVTANYDGAPLATEITVSTGSEIVSYDSANDQIIALGTVGEAVISIAYTVEEEAKVLEIPVSVKPVTYDNGDEIASYSALHGASVDPAAKTFAGILGGPVLHAYDVEGNELSIINGIIYGIPYTEEGTIDTVITVADNSKGYKVTVTGYGGIISSVDDLALFDINAMYGVKAEISDKKDLYAVDATKPMGLWNGLYILTNDIDASAYTHAPHATALNQRGVASMTTKCGFAGTFDGQGHTITGITLGAFGLFGYINEGAVIKNVAFVDVTLQGDYSTVLAQNVQLATISDVYVSVANDAPIACGSKAGASVLMNGVVGSTVSNVIIETKPTFGYSAGANKGSFTYRDDEKIKEEKDYARNTFANVFVISNEELAVYGAYYTLVAQNDEREENAESKIYKLNGVFKYADAAAMLAAENDYTPFENANWVVDENAIPVWNTLYVDPAFSFTVNGSETPEDITIHTIDGNSAAFVISAAFGATPLAFEVAIADNALLTYNAGVITSTGYIGDTTVTVTCEYENVPHQIVVNVHILPTIVEGSFAISDFSAVHGDSKSATKLQSVLGANVDIAFAYDADFNPLTVVDNKVYGVEMSKTGSATKTIYVCNAQQGYEVSVTGYSGIFETMADFEVFSEIRKNFTGTGKIKATQQEGVGVDIAKFCKFDGYYVLADDIDATGYVQPTAGYCTKGWEGTGNFVNSGLGLTGTFDGQGHTISNLTLANVAFNTGLFQLVNGGTVKNLGIVDITSAGEGAQVSTFAYIMIDPTFENVYVKVNGFSMVQQFAICSLLYQTTPGAAHFNNVLVENNFNVDGTLGVNGGVFYSLTGATTSAGTGRADRDETILDVTNLYVVGNIGFYYRQNKPASGSKFYGIGYDENERALYVAVEGIADMPAALIPEGIAAPAVEQIATELYVKGGYHYADTAAMVAAAHDLSSFTETGLWHVDGTGALVWGPAAV